MRKEYKTIREVAGPLMLVDQVEGVKYDELVEIEQSDGRIRRGKVLEINQDKALLQLFEGSQGLRITDSSAKFLGHSIELAVAPDMLGRVFDGMGRPIDGGHQRRPHKPRREGLPQRVHTDRHFRNRRPEHAGTRPEAAGVLRLWPAPCKPCGPDSPSG